MSGPVIDWASKPEPWCRIGPAFRLECEKIVGQKAARPDRAQSGSAVDVGRGRISPLARADGPLDTGGGQTAKPKPAERMSKSQPAKRSFPTPQRRRATGQQEWPKAMVPAEDAAAIDEFLKRRGATVLPAGYAAPTTAAKP